jgi:hypothetical protein
MSITLAGNKPSLIAGSDNEIKWLLFFVGCHSMPGLPDGTFSNPKIPIWVNF